MRQFRRAVDEGVGPCRDGVHHEIMATIGVAAQDECKLSVQRKGIPPATSDDGDGIKACAIPGTVMALADLLTSTQL
jgi:hypothetical protein